MKKISFLMLLALAFLLSCRTDQFPEKEIYNNTSSFQPTSKRISLNESKHKAKLLPEIEQLENKFKTLLKNNLQGKLVDYGNGVSIDTDEVIYIENGTNYHTYTFSIYRENAPVNAPLENLVLSLLPDGSYQEFLVTYNLTAQEKEKIRNGEPVSTKGKTTITELAKGSFNANGQLLQAKTTCSWNDVTIVYGCSQIDKSTGNSVHNANNMSDWHNCTAETKPAVFTAGYWDCSPEKLDNYISPGSNPGGGSGGGGGDPGTPPDDCANVATNPTQIGIVNPNGCNTGFPTQPNPNVKSNQDLINELQGYPCAQNLVQQLPNLKNDLAMSMKQIFQNNKNYNIIFRAKSGLGDVDGNTQVITSAEFDNFKAIININDQVLTNATKEYILVTLYHEVIHAFLRYELFKLGATAFQEKYLGVVVGYDYDSNGNVINRFTFLPQHQEVGAFLSTLENILSLYNPTLSSATIKAMAKAGITTMTQTETQLNNNERNTLLGNYLGTKCP